MMSERDQYLINELVKAMEAGSFLMMSSSSLRMPSNPEDFINMAELFVRKVIKVVKNVTYFKQLHKDDQMSLLKGSVVDIMMLRSAVNYDPFTESWSLNTKGCINHGSSQATGERISAEILKSGSTETKQLFMTYSKFIKSLMSTIHGDLLALKILILMSLFSGWFIVVVVIAVHSCISCLHGKVASKPTQNSHHCHRVCTAAVYFPRGGD